MSAWGSCPWAIYSPECGISKEERGKNRKERREYRVPQMSYSVSFGLLAPGPFTPPQALLFPSKIKLYVSLPVDSSPQSTTPPPQTPALACQCQRSGLLGHPDKECDCPIFLSSSSASLLLQHAFIAAALTKTLYRAEKAVVVAGWRGEARDRLQIYTTPPEVTEEEKDKN